MDLRGNLDNWQHFSWKSLNVCSGHESFSAEEPQLSSTLLPAAYWTLLVCGNAYLADIMPWFPIWISCPKQAGKLLLCFLVLWSTALPKLKCNYREFPSWEPSCPVPRAGRPLPASDLDPKPVSPLVPCTLLLFHLPCWSRLFPQNFKKCTPEEIPILPTTDCYAVQNCGCLPSLRTSFRFAWPLPPQSSLWSFL